MSGAYYVPEKSHWPLVGSIGLFVMAFGAINLFHDNTMVGMPIFLIGTFTIVFMMFGWFKDVIYENRNGLHNAQMDRSYRWGMFWFIFSEVMFFAAFFGALFYVRHYALPSLSGALSHATTHELLWPKFQAAWPLFVNPDNTQFVGPKEVISPWGIPLLNTVLLLSSAVTLTWAHWGMLKNQRTRIIIGLTATIILGTIFLGFQGYEYYSAYVHEGLTLGSGIFGSTFFMLTGFHGMHVTVGAIMLLVILLRCIKGDFSVEHHFGFEAVAWYWHFVDVVWLFLFIFVYWI